MRERCLSWLQNNQSAHGHPNVVSVLDVVALEGELFLVMDFIKGDSLGKLLRAARAKKPGGIAPPIACSIMAGALHGLHAAHEARSERGAPLKIVHRDVSPQNILVGTDGVTRVVDFGIAMAANRVQTTRDGHGLRWARRRRIGFPESTD